MKASFRSSTVATRRKKVSILYAVNCVFMFTTTQQQKAAMIATRGKYGCVFVGSGVWSCAICGIVFYSHICIYNNILCDCL